MNGQFIASQAKDPASSSLVSLDRAIAEEMDAVCHEVRWRQNEDERLVEACDEFIDELSEAGSVLVTYLREGFLRRRAGDGTGNGEDSEVVDISPEEVLPEVLAAVTAKSRGKLKKASDLEKERARILAEKQQKAKKKKALSKDSSSSSSTLTSRSLKFCEEISVCKKGESGAGKKRKDGKKSQKTAKQGNRISKKKKNSGEL